jgi:hypothetical protein
MSEVSTQSGVTDQTNANLNTPSKTKPALTKSIDIDGHGKVSTDDSQFVTMIKVTEAKDMRKWGAGQYSELPSISDKLDRSAQVHLRRASSASNTNDIRIPDSYSFFYGAKTTEKESLYAKVKKTPSMKEGGTRSSEVANLKRNPTVPARARPQMEVRRYAYKSATPSASNQTTPDLMNGRLRTTSAIKAPTDPIYEDIPAYHTPQTVPVPPLPNGFHKVHSETGSVATNSLSSMSTTPTNTPSLSSDDSALRKTYPITRVNGLPDTPEDSYDLVDTNMDKNMTQDSAFYSKQVDDVIDSLNQVLNDAVSGRNLPEWCTTKNIITFV